MQIVCLYGVCNVHCAFSHLLSQVSFIIIMHAWYGMASNIQIFNCRDKNREEKVSPIKVPLVAAENIYMHKQQAQARPTPSTFGKRKNQLPYLFITIRSYIIIIVRFASSWKQHAYVLKNTYETHRGLQSTHQKLRALACLSLMWRAHTPRTLDHCW